MYTIYINMYYVCSYYIMLYWVMQSKCEPCRAIWRLQPGHKIAV